MSVPGALIQVAISLPCTLVESGASQASDAASASCPFIAEDCRQVSTMQAAQLQQSGEISGPAPMQQSAAELPTFDSQLSTTGQGVACRTTQSQVTRTVMGNCSTRRVRKIFAESSAQGPGLYALTSAAKVSAAQGSCLQ